MEISLIIFITAYSIYNLYNSYINSYGIYRLQIIYTIFEIVPALIIGSIFNLILPLFKIYTYIYIGPIGLLLFIFPLYISMSKHKFWGGTYIINKILEYLSLSIFTFIIFYIAFIIQKKLFGSIFNIYAYILGFILSLFFVINFNLIRSKFENMKSSSEIIFNEMKNYLLNETDVKNIINEISKNLSFALNSKKIEFYFHQKSPYSLADLSYLIKENNGILILDYLSTNPPNMTINENAMQSINKLLSKDILVIIKNQDIEIFIYSKNNNKSITIIEEKLLNDFVQYLFIAFQKLDLIINLQKKVAIATKELEENNKKIGKS